MPHPSGDQGVHFLADVVTEDWLQLLASDEALEMRPRFTIVANLSGGGSVLDVWQVGHCVANGDGPQGSGGESSDVGFDLQRVKTD